ncbi:MFS transporter [Metabacillus dongyingensis]|uniref:MFS transporter n=1 Tax=Metabacillus dongyingensis TaxID=2874282 RepID=UPI001CBD124A|nr:MFS transporter [Metabacillus dongyingensis]UAL54638.1 MFS transporter [Metabacillus dongyingensis]
MVSEENKLSKWCIVSMASIPLVMTLGNSMLIPVLPIFEKEVGITPFQSSMVITSYSIASIILIPFAGYLSDRIGRKAVILPSLFIALIGGLVAGFASWKLSDPYTMIILGRILQGIGAAGASPIILPLVGDLYKNDDEKASSCLGVVETSNTFGKVLSPIIGSLFASILWFVPFFSISFFSLISILLVFFFIKVPKRKEKPAAFKEFLSKTKKTFHQEGKWLYLLFALGAFVMLILFAVLFFLSNHLEKVYLLKGIKKGFLLAIPLMVLCTSAFITGKCIKGDMKIMRIITIFCLLILSLSVPFIGYVKNDFFWLFFVTSIIGMAIGAMLPTLDAIVTENIEKEERGTITSFYSSARFIGVALGPPIMTAVTKNYLNLSFITAGITGILLLWLVIKNFKAKPEKRKMIYF